MLLSTDQSETSVTPDWYKDAVIYQVHIKSFCDGNGDGVGDFKGLISKLDYLERLGVTAVWLLPFYPSPLRDDGYDIADYQKVHPDYGTLGDFKRFLREAHARDLKVITELVMNHTSDQHKWFQRARKAKPGTVARDYYVWSEAPDKYTEARIIFQDFELSNWTWDPVAKAYFWHRFYSHQPDLNFDSPKVHEEMLKVLDFWFSMGVDGMRLDAVPYLYEREGTNCENLPETHEFLRKVRAHIEANHEGKMLLAEANQWPEDAARYFGEGDSCHMAFHFPLMPRMFMALEMENRYPIIDILEQTPDIPESCQWALFLRNHDELTLEMVTDEERDYMYRIYVTDPRARVNLGIRRRLAPLLDNDRRKIELLNVLLMSMPGSPVVYYGDEIGMGDNYYLGDRDGVRTPMQWNTDANAGFSRANPQQLYLPLVIDPEYHYASLNVATQENRSTSLLWWMRHLISLRKQYSCFGRGEIEFLNPDNPKVLAFTRTLGHEKALIVANLSRYAQQVDLELEGLEGWTPEDLFSRNSFRPVEDEDRYPISMGAYVYYVFILKPPQVVEEEAGDLPRAAGRSWWNMLEDKAVRGRMETHVLPRYIVRQRWYGGKARKIRRLQILEWVQIRKDESTPLILILRVDYQEGDPEIYILPVAYAPVPEPPEEENGAAPPEMQEYELPSGSMAWLKLQKSEGAMYEAVYSRRFSRILLDIIAGRKRLSSRHGMLRATSSKYLKQLWKDKEVDLTPRLLGAEQSNTSILYGDKLILKLYRRTSQGVHPDVETVRFLTERAGFQHIPPYAGSVEHQVGDGRIFLGLMQQFIPNQGDAWELFMDLAPAFFQRVLTKVDEGQAPPKPPKSLMAAAEGDIPSPLDELMSGVTLEMTWLLGKRTAQMHLALASDHDDPDFAPETFSTLYQRALFQAMQNEAKQELRFMRRRVGKLPADVQEAAREVLGLEKTIMARLHQIIDKKLRAWKIRIHGDYHLGQVLYTGKDFVIFDFEGEPSRPLSERRLKRSPIRDVAGMIRSFQYAAYTGLFAGGAVREEDAPGLQPWADLWYQYVAGQFLRGYCETIGDHPVAPTEPEALEKLLVPYLLEKAIYEMGYELNNRPDWLIIPLRGIQYLCGE